MKKILTTSLLSLMFFGGAAHAQSMATGIDATQIKGGWNCKVNYPFGNSFMSVNSHSDFDEAGKFSQNDTLTLTSQTGQTLPMNVTGVGRWRYESTTRRVIQTLDAVNVTFDVNNPLALTVGNALQKAYQESIGVAQPSFVVRLNEKEWIGFIGEVGKNGISVDCTR